MAKFIPYDRLSRKKRREVDQAQRLDWGPIKPVTRCPQRSDAYSRKQDNRRWQAEARKELPTHGDFYCPGSLSALGAGNLTGVCTRSAAL